MPNDPFIVVEKVIIDNRRDNWFQETWHRWVIGLVLLAVGFAWMMFHTRVGREPELPNRPLTEADLPLLRKKVAALRMDAGNASLVFPHLNKTAEIKIANQAWAELYYTPDIYPVAVQLRRIQFAHILELRPDLAEHVRVKQEYEEGRYKIANDPSVTDKAAAIAALEKQLGPAATGREYSKNAAQAMAVLTDLIGDPELDQAELAYKNACRSAILKRHPELAEYNHEMETRDAAYQAFMAQANALSRRIKVLEGGTEPARPVAAKPEPPTTDPAKTADAGNGNVPTNRPDMATAQPTPSDFPESAVLYGVQTGDIVAISALKPVIALHRATITAMDNEQLTVRDGNDTYIVRWKDLTQLKPSGKK
jgi:hypothetical protein